MGRRDLQHPPAAGAPHNPAGREPFEATDAPHLVDPDHAERSPQADTVDGLRPDEHGVRAEPIASTTQAPAGRGGDHDWWR